MQKTAIPFIKGVTGSGEGLDRNLERSKDQGVISRSRQITKTLLVMKLTIVFLTAAFLNVSASGLSQNISFSGKNVSLEKVFAEVKKQTGFIFLYEESVINNSKPVTISAEKVPIEKLLAEIFRSQPLKYSIKGKSIFISLKSSDVRLSSGADDLLPPPPIRVRIIDADGQPLAGASVVNKNTKKAGVTDAGGYLSLNVSEGDVLAISFIGYQSTEYKITAAIAASSDRQPLVLSLSRKENSIEGVTVLSKGYYNVTRATNTGNVSVVTNKDIVKSGLGNPITALAGQVPGLFIIQNSGLPGGPVSVQLRGTNSISNGNNPLYIIDGIPFYSQTLTTGNGGGAALSLSSFAGLNPDNIVKIEVLKDADATAIYGSRGANGVILITTKKGAAGKTSLNVNVYSGAGEVGRRLDLMNTEQYLQMRRKALANDGVTTIPTASRDLTGVYGDINKYTDWQEIFIGGTAHVTDANASISGGSEKTQFLVGGGYRRETTVFPGDYADRKASFNANVNHNEGKFNTSFSVNYMNDNNRLPTANFTEKILLPPNAPDLYTPEGEFNWQNAAWVNPLWETTQQTKNLTETINSSLTLGYEWIPGLSTSVRVGYNMARNHYNALNPFIKYRPNFEVLPGRRTNLYGDNQVNTWSVEPTATYTRHIGGGKLETLLGGTFQQTDNNGMYGSAAGFASPEMIENVAAGTLQSIDGYINSRYRYSAIYARIAYNFQDKYLVNLTGRRDASSRFGPGKQFANLGAIGAAWIFSNEKAISEALPFLSFGKIRSSYGITGNDQLTDYDYLSLYQSTGSIVYQTYGGLVPRSLTNSVYGWETVKKLETGIELGFVDDRLLINASWYRNRTGNQLVGYALPSITGFTNVRANLPSVIQNTGAEFDLIGRILKSSQLKWTVTGNLTIPKNKLVSYPDLESSSYASRYIVGQPLSIQFLYNYTGIDRAKQIYTFEDRNGDGQISGQPDYVPVFIGQKFYGGLTNSFEYKGVQLDVFFQFVKQNGLKFFHTTPGEFNNTYANQLSDLLDMEVNGEIAKFTQQPGSDAWWSHANYINSTGMLQDASFIRLKNVSLSWRLPEKMLKTLKLSALSLYVRGQNLLTITDFKGFDPENGAGSVGVGQLSVPPLRTFTAGIQLSL